jgi:hypothetical protein
MTRETQKTASLQAVTTKLGPLVFAGLLVTLAAFYTIRNREWTFEDSFITYRYADNLRQGHGLVFNVGERHYGSTAMGFAIILAGCSWLLGPLGARYTDIHGIAQIFSATSVAALAWISYRIIGRLVPSPRAALVGALITALYLFSDPASNFANGHETYPFLAILACGAYLLFFRCQNVTGAICLGVSPMLRPDCALLVILALAMLAIRQQFWRDVGWRQIGVAVTICVLIGGAWISFTTLYFGSPIPETLVAKRAQVLLGHFPLFSLNLVADELRRLAPKATAIVLLIGLGEVGYATIAMSRTPADAQKIDLAALAWSLSWVLFGGGLVLAYLSFKITYWHWYLLPVHFGLVMAAVATVPRVAMQRGRVAGVLFVMVSLVVAADAPRIARDFASWLQHRPVNQHVTSYDPIVAFLHAREPHGTTVATGEPGSLGWKLGPQYLVVDELGLASPDVARHLMAGDFDYPFVRWKPQYVIIANTGLFSPERRWWFDHAYRRIGEFPHPYWQATQKRGALLFQRVADPAALIAAGPRGGP